jgi:hypothetical protein
VSSPKVVAPSFVEAVSLPPSNGRVRHADPGDQVFSIGGRVATGGRVNIEVSRGDLHAYGIGRRCRRLSAAGRGTLRTDVPDGGKPPGAGERRTRSRPDFLPRRRAALARLGSDRRRKGDRRRYEKS